MRAPFCSSRGGGGPRGRRGGGRGLAARGRRPPSKSPPKCSGLQKKAAGSAEQAARPGAAGECRGCWWVPVPSARGSGSPCPCGAGLRGTSGSQACPRLDALGLAAAGAQGFESGPREGACLGPPRSGGPAANMLRKGELEPQGQVGVGCARGRAESPGAARELPGAEASGRGSSLWQAGGLCGDAPAEGMLLSLSPRRGPVARHGICFLDQAARPRDLGSARSFRDHSELLVMEGAPVSWDLSFASIKFCTCRLHPLRRHTPPASAALVGPRPSRARVQPAVSTAQAGRSLTERPGLPGEARTRASSLQPSFGGPQRRALVTQRPRVGG